MSSLVPFRAWRFANSDTAPISILKNPERKPDDRSPFVRYARSAALWAEWVRDGIVILDEEPALPTINGFQLGVLPLDNMTASMSVLPSAKEHLQRLLEGVLLYADPIVVTPRANGYTVVANHELNEAARSYQEDMARPGKVRPSDHALVAVAGSDYLDTLRIQPLAFTTTKSEEDVSQDLQGAGYILSPRTEDPDMIVVAFDGKTYTKAPETSAAWKRQLANAIGVKSLDMGSKLDDVLTSTSGKKIVLTAPKMTKSVLEMGMEYPYGSISTEILPPSGAMMWNLRDF